MLVHPRKPLRKNASLAFIIKAMEIEMSDWMERYRQWDMVATEVQKNGRLTEYDNARRHAMECWERHQALARYLEPLKQQLKKKKEK